jgi:hypothetical protein
MPVECIARSFKVCIGGAVAPEAVLNAFVKNYTVFFLAMILCYNDKRKRIGINFTGQNL